MTVRYGYIGICSNRVQQIFHSFIKYKCKSKGQQYKLDIYIYIFHLEKFVCIFNCQIWIARSQLDTLTGWKLNFPGGSGVGLGIKTGRQASRQQKRRIILLQKTLVRHFYFLEFSFLIECYYIYYIKIYIMSGGNMENRTTNQ